MHNKLFQNLGLTDKEAKVYLASLEIGTNPVSEIGKKAKLNRVTTYDILEKLSKKGLVNTITRRNIKYFSATDPELVATEYKKRASELFNAIPELKKLRGQNDHPKIQYFEGLEGIKRVYADSLNSTTEILNYCNVKELRNYWPSYDDDYSKERIARGIELKGIAPDDEFGKILQAQDQQTRREIRLIPQDKFNFGNEINIYENKVAIISIKGEPLAILIENADIAESQKAIFNIVWEFAGFKAAPFSLPKADLPPASLSQSGQDQSNQAQSGQSATSRISSFFGAKNNTEMTIRKVGGVKEKKADAAENQVSLF